HDQPGDVEPDEVEPQHRPVSRAQFRMGLQLPARHPGPDEPVDTGDEDEQTPHGFPLRLRAGSCREPSGSPRRVGLALATYPGALSAVPPAVAERGRVDT